MTVSFAIKTIIEILLIVLLAYGYYHEDKVIRFERKMFRFIRFMINSYRQDKARKNLTVHSCKSSDGKSGASVA